jgi:hypothetical protein
VARVLSTICLFRTPVAATKNASEIPGGFSVCIQCTYNRPTCDISSVNERILKVFNFDIDKDMINYLTVNIEENES